MSVEDIAPGMSIEIAEQGSTQKYSTEVVKVSDGKILLAATSQTANFLCDVRKKKFEVNIVVSNAMYNWKEVIAEKKTVEGQECYLLAVEGKPSVMNRRKHPRLPMRNACEVVLKTANQSFKAQMVNISAGGYAFACKAPEFAEAIGERVQLTIQNFPLMNGKALDGIVIRSTDDHGTYIVGCRMLRDNKEIQAYVEREMK